MRPGSDRVEAGEPRGVRATASPAVNGAGPPPERPGPAFLRGGGEGGAGLRAPDWAGGPPDACPQPLRTALRLLLSADYPMQLWWGPERLAFHNDAWRRSIGGEG